MKKKIIVLIGFLLNIFLFVSMPAYADLFNRGTDSAGNRLIYDSDFNITWYDYSHSYTLDSQDDEWQNSLNWASDLTVNIGGNIYDEWRLPKTLNRDGTGPCTGINCTESEWGHLFYVALGNEGTSGEPTGCGFSTFSCLTNTGPFQNLQGDYSYWTDMETDFEYVAFLFKPFTGSQFEDIKYNDNTFAIAVLDGDVVAAVVPEPISSILFITGGTLFAGRRYMKRKK